MLQAVLVVLLLFLIFYKYSYAPYQVFKHSGIKGPRPTSFFGHYLEIKKKGIVEFERELSMKYGSVFGYYIGQATIIVLNEPELIKQVAVKKFDSFRNRFLGKRTKFLENRLPNGLLTAVDEDWRQKRQLLTPTFSAAKMKSMVPLIEDSVKTLVEIVGDSSDTGKSIDFFRMYSCFTMETILATAFGRKVEVQKGEASLLAESASNMFKEAGDLTNLIQLILSNFPWMDSVLAYFMKPDPSFVYLYTSACSLANIRREEHGGAKHKDLLQLMLDATGDEGDVTSCPMETGSKKFTDKEVANNSVTFLVAGYETTANTLTYTTYLLAVHPHIQGKLRADIEEYYQENPEATLYEAASDIKYLDMVIQETLRLYPVIPRFGHRCNTTTTIDGLVFPEDSIVVFPVYMLHHDTRFWDEPDKFDPLRFTPEEKAKRPQLSHMPFGSGPRNCIGMRFALLECKIALIELLRGFTFLKAPDTEVPLKIKFGVSLSPENGVYLRVTKSRL